MPSSPANLFVNALMVAILPKIPAVLFSSLIIYCLSVCLTTATPIHSPIKRVLLCIYSLIKKRKYVVKYAELTAYIYYYIIYFSLTYSSVMLNTPKTVSSIVWMLTLNFTVSSVICSIFISVRYMAICVLCSVSCMLSRFFVVW